MNPHQWNRLVLEVQVRLLAAMLILLGLAGLTVVVTLILRWAGAAC